ncbi:hypothetical protein [Motiliproteus sp. SC1-56]|uniref:hypothetical protein n=1 Tax=Motiliproteus sp. SC1-56 TaxID=2799565 RepID=UPI001A8F52AB|nr:hypothetical protein [Motiliproteus sp. SC1-56]
MRRVTLVLANRIEGRLLSSFSFEEVQLRINRAIPQARWAYLGYKGNRFCLDTVVSEGKLPAVEQQARQQPYVKQVLSEPWPARA